MSYRKKMFLSPNAIKINPTFINDLKFTVIDFAIYILYLTKCIFLLKTLVITALYLHQIDLQCINASRAYIKAMSQ